jgi:predicted dehydrogenase
VLRTADGETVIPSAQGDYTTYYEEFAAAIAAGTAGPVPVSSAIQTLRVLDAARQSALERRVIAL